MKYFLDTEFLEGTQKTFFGKSKPTIDLISIGMVDENGREFYAISKDFNLKEAWNRWQQRTGEGDRNNIEPRLYWIRENVLRPLFHDLRNIHNKKIDKMNNLRVSHSENWLTGDEFSYKVLKKLLNKYGKNNNEIANDICAFIYGDDCGGSGMSAIEMAMRYEISDKTKEPEFYAYYADYDWVAFCWLFGNMMKLPKGFPMYCKDLKQTFDEVQEQAAKKQFDLAGQYSKPITMALAYDVTNLKHDTKYPKQENEHNALADAKWNFKLFEFVQKCRV